MPDDTPVYKILALAPFNPDQTTIWEGAPWPIDRHSFDEVIELMHLHLFQPLDKFLCPEGGIDLHVNSLKSLHPDGIAKNTPYFTKLIQAKTFITDARRNGLSASDIRQGLHQWPDLPPIHVKDVRPEPTPSTKTRLENILDMVAISENQPAAMSHQKEETEQIEQIIQQILAALFANPIFNEMESAWRGTRLLVQQGFSDATHGRICIASVHLETLEKSLEALTPHLLDDLPNAILLDLPFDNRPLSFERLKTVVEWAGTLMVPVIAWVPSDFLSISSWQDIHTLPFIPNHIDTIAYAKFANLRTANEGQWVCLLCNRFLIRYPYGEENKPRHVAFSENRHPWVSPVWAAGTLIAQSFEKTGWPTRMTDIRSFHVQDLALQTLHSIGPIVSETLFGHDRQDQLLRAGITPLTAEAGRDIAFFPKLVSITGTSLSFQLLLSQTTQFVLWCKDHLPTETNPAELKAQLEKAFLLFSNQSTPPGFEHIEITVQSTNMQGRLPVHITLTPQSFVVTNQKQIELHIDW